MFLLTNLFLSGDEAGQGSNMTVGGDGYDEHERVSEQLENISPEWLFGGVPFGLDERHKSYLIKLFYMRYAGRNIGTLSLDQFRSWVHEIILSKWLQYYKPMYESLFLVNPDNWDLNVNLQNAKNGNFVNNGERTGIEKGDKERATNSVNYESNVEQQFQEGTEYGAKSSADEHDRNGSHREHKNRQDWHQGEGDTLRADTPQEQSNIGGFKPIWDRAGAVNETGTGSGAINPPNQEDNFNDGYITDGERVSNSDNSWEQEHKGDDFLETEKRITGESHGNTNTHSRQRGSERGGGNRGNSKANETNVRHLDRRDYGQRKEQAIKSGLINIASSDMLNKYRGTLISVDNMFMKEFWNLFLRVY